MFKTIGISIVLLFLSVLQVQGQKPDFVYYDSLTYHQYINKDYGALLKTGKEALHAGFDYYYLRMRMGIAAYQKKQYRVAAVHFEKALHFNDNDLVREYLYYAYLWGGEPLLAQKSEKGMSSELQKKLKLKKKGLLSAEAVAAFLTRNGNVPDDFAIPDKEGLQVIPKQFYDVTVNLRHKLGAKSQMTHVISYLNKQNEKYYYTDNKHYFDPAYNTNQFQYYIGTFFSLNRSWGLHVNGQVSVLAMPEYTETRGRMGYTYLVKTNAWQTDYVLSASVVKDFAFVSVEGGLALVNIGNQAAWQPELLFRIYPFANLDLYTESGFFYQLRSGEAAFFQQQKIGGKLFRKLWLEGSYFSGGVSGFVLDNSVLLFNGPEEIKWMAGGKLIYMAGSRTKLTLGYQHRRQATWFVPVSNTETRSNKTSLNYSLFYILVSWSF